MAQLLAQLRSTEPRGPHAAWDIPIAIVAIGLPVALCENNVFASRSFEAFSALAASSGLGAGVSSTLGGWASSVALTVVTAGGCAGSRLSRSRGAVGAAEPSFALLPSGDT